jgi:hypothetical protein
VSATYVAVPEDWTRVRTRRVGPFVTGAIFRRPDGSLVHWSSRANRKQRQGDQGSTLWAPRAIGWWIAVLFMVGSTCFAIGPLPFYLEWVGDKGDAITYFIGSIFFTSAAFLQLVETGIAPRSQTLHSKHRVRILIAVESRRIDWWACAVQFVGTLFFNVTTFVAITPPANLAAGKNAVWTPDWRGSICFMIASWLAYAEVGHHWFSWKFASRSWRIAALNMVGSIAFLASAFGAYVLPTTGEPWSLFWANFGTFLGAICFFWGAALLLPERTHPDEPATNPPALAT